MVWIGAKFGTRSRHKRLARAGGRPYDSACPEGFPTTSQQPATGRPGAGCSSPELGEGKSRGEVGSHNGRDSNLGQHLITFRLRVSLSFHRTQGREGFVLPVARRAARRRSLGREVVR